LQSWQRRAAGEVEYTASESGVVVFFAPISPLRDADWGQPPVGNMPPAAGMIEVIPAGADTWARWNEDKDTAHFVFQRPSSMKLPV